VTNSPAWRSVEQVYAGAFAESDAFDHALDQSMQPRGFGLLLDLVAELGLEPGATAVDVGCRMAHFSISLARRFSLNVHGIDPLTHHIDGARAALAELVTAEPDVAARVQVEIGKAEQLSEPDDSVALIWCRDVLEHVPDLGAVFREFRRVMRPDGHAVIYEMMATDWLEPQEAERLWPPIGVYADSVNPKSFDAAITDSGLTIDQCIDLHGEWRERDEEDGDGMTSRQLIHASRLIRSRQEFQDRFGVDAYNAVLNNCLWGVYQMIGKLSPRIYVLSRSAAS
jgi:SAM-dependent methyltransferase